MASRPRKAAPRSRRVSEPKLNGEQAESLAAVTLPTPTDDDVRVAAYHKWVAAGSPPGDDMRFWFEAERELRATAH